MKKYFALFLLLSPLFFSSCTEEEEPSPHEEIDFRDPPEDEDPYYPTYPY
ncbi:hypothetical protein [Flammeovirga kamogawensis]|uniref:Uncharacterized protein n=1 Tax=Flammeovirga kamogawensis TaxID=373891 RepID=A0ABX8GXU4_9BACT|nr:hypothetical protein [Flammeovirga kamogawensis]MBB6462852.1 hypothetical protein [Flammeovirga kamogawensis]QWG08366.1 hypothetical protein KM029_05370 [Flammeovirga kamogawensis]